MLMTWLSLFLQIVLVFLIGFSKGVSPFEMMPFVVGLFLFLGFISAFITAIFIKFCEKRHKEIIYKKTEYTLEEIQKEGDKSFFAMHSGSGRYLVKADGDTFAIHPNEILNLESAQMEKPELIEYRLKGFFDIPELENRRKYTLIVNEEHMCYDTPTANNRIYHYYEFDDCVDE